MNNRKLKYLFKYPFKDLRIKKAMTLTELLVASILIGIILVGAVSIDYAIRRSRNTISASILIATQISAAMKQITRDAVLAVGDITDPGIVFDATGDDTNICFRLDTPSTPGDYNDDTWTCYSQGDTNGTHTLNEIYRCAGIANGSQLGNGDSCTPALNETFVLETRALGFFNIILMPEFKFNLRSCADNNIAIDEHPINNPCYELISQISPPGISRQLP